MSRVGEDVKQTELVCVAGGNTSRTNCGNKLYGGGLAGICVGKLIWLWGAGGLDWSW